MGKKQKILKIDNLGQKKLRIFMIIGFILLFLLIIRIAFLQFVQGASLKQRAVNNQLSSKILAANRGTIYDSTGKALAISAKVDNVSINPSKVKYKNGELVETEVLANKFSEIFELNYEETLEKLNNHESSFIIASKVEGDKVIALQNWMKENNINSGISTSEDIKRYYPYGNLASHLIGFTGTENTGRAGLEYTLNSILARNTWKKTNIYRFY